MSSLDRGQWTGDRGLHCVAFDLTRPESRVHTHALALRRQPVVNVQGEGLIPNKKCTADTIDFVHIPTHTLLGENSSHTLLYTTVDDDHTLLYTTVHYCTLYTTVHYCTLL